MTVKIDLFSTEDQLSVGCFSSHLDVERFYIYGHFTKDTKELFYIGKGTSNRMTSTSGRSKGWYEVAKQRGVLAKILVRGLTEVDALTEENRLILSNKSNSLLVNKSVNIGKCTITLEELQKLVVISPSSPSGLVWLTNRAGLEGKTAGGLRNKYWVCQINGKTFPTSRLVYLLHNKTIDWNLQVDHIDGDTSNNNPENLRLVSKRVNSKNRIIKNETGIPFIRQKTDKSGKNYFCVVFTLKGRRVLVSFANDKYKDSLNSALNYLISIIPVLRMEEVSERVINKILEARDEIC